MKNFYKLLIISILFLFIMTPTSLADDFIDEEIIDVNAEISTFSNANSSNELNPKEINSRACVVIDRNTNTILYGKNENEKKKMASTTKIMTATIIIENCNLDNTIEVSKKAASTGGSRLGLKTGDKITIRDLLYGLMLRSGNDAAVALAEYAGKDIKGFSELMNKKAESLKLKNTHFETPHGLDSDKHYTSAYELALLSNYALNNKTFAQIVGTKNYTITINGYPKTISNTNELLGNLNGVYGIKTGFTNGANRCLVTACKRNDMDVICVVLGADTKKYRTQDSIKLINYIMDNYEQVNIQDIINREFENWKKENLKSFYINKGISQYVDLQIDCLNFTSIPIRKDLKDSINVTINCEKYFEAPINENQEIGNIQISWSDSNVINAKIYIANQIEKKHVFYYLKYFLSNFSNIINNYISN